MIHSRLDNLKFFAILHSRLPLVEFKYSLVILILPISIFCILFSPISHGNEDPDPSGVILQYHHIADDTPPSTSTSLEDFQSHIQHLSHNNFSVWSLDKLVTTFKEGALKQDQAIPERVVSITFDDAFEDIYVNAWPLLRELEWPFTLFISSDSVGKKGFLNWDQISEMSLGGMTIANHTQKHSHLMRKIGEENHEQWLKRIKEEIVNAELEISRQIPSAARMKLFAFPYGEYNTDILNLLKSLGYIGFGQQSGAVGRNANFLALPRFPLSGVYADLATFKIKARTLAMPLSPSTFVDPELKIRNKRPSLKLIFTGEDYQFSKLSCYGPEGKMLIRKINKNTYLSKSSIDLPIGRSRYNCTMPATTSVEDGEAIYYWYSQLWIRKNNDGSWYPEH
ncbi:MAG: biofilm PGA synthesis lipoprotein PgaB [Candidatus Azotimanducaceae bacterium]